MLNEKEVKQFEILRFRAETVEGEVQAYKDALSKEFDKRQQIKKEYETARLQALKREMESRELAWCTVQDLFYERCETPMVPRDEMVLIYVESASVRTRGSDYDRGDVMEDLNQLFRACPRCVQKMRDRHGKVGSYEPFWKKAPFFNAFSVEKKPDGLYMRKFGNLIKLTDEQVDSLRPMPDHVVDRYAKEWGLPPRLQADHDGKIVIGQFDLALTG